MLRRGAGGEGSALDRAETIGARLRGLTAFLVAHQELWEARPFTEVPPAWAAGLEGGAVAFIEGLAHEEIDRLEASAAPGLGLPAPLGAIAQEAAALVAVERARADGGAAVPPREAMYVPGRKMEQVEAFVRAAARGLDGSVGGVDGRDGMDHLVDWCAGKGHLGRELARLTGLAVTLVELDARLGPEAERLAARAGIAARFLAADALTPTAWEALSPRRAAVALHACGGLTDALLREGTRRDVARMVVAPCCYHKHQPALTDAAARALAGAEPTLPPRSRGGAACGLTLTHGALRLATADEVVAPRRHRRARRRENAWRLGLDLLLREASGRDAYTPLGAIPRRELTLPFAAFCAQVTERLELTLPARWDAARGEERGWERARRARAWGVVRGVFRRPIELWLVLDRALALAEAGRSVTVEVFCDVAVTPRNLLIRSDRG